MTTNSIHDKTGATGREECVANNASAMRIQMTGGAQVAGHFRRHHSFVMALFAACALVGCADMNTPPPVPAEARASKPSVTLAPGDEISVAFSSTPELNTRQKIQPNGKVSMPTIGDVSAAGKTITGLQEQLTTLYQPHLQDPTIVVSLANAAAGVYVSGEVLHAGKIPLDRPMTALEAVMEAGGFTKFANPNKVMVVRNQGGKNHQYVLNMNDTLSGRESTPFYVRP